MKREFTENSDELCYELIVVLHIKTKYEDQNNLYPSNWGKGYFLLDKKDS